MAMTTSTPERRPTVTLAPTDRVALIAGSGRLPVNVAEGLEAAGHPPFVVIVGGEGVSAELTAYAHQTLELERMGDVGSLFRREKITHIVLAGGIGRRPWIARMRPSWTLIKALRRVIPALLSKGDNAVLAAIVRFAEDNGYRIVGAHELVPDLLAAEGALTRAEPTAADGRDIDAAFAAAKALGALDVGQAAVAIGGRVIAVEDVEGTDGLLARVKTLRAHPRLATRQRGVLVKCAKPGQELRADLPSIGPRTVEAAHEAGLAGIGVEAGRSIVLDHEVVRRQADDLGLFVIGLPEKPS
jgi:UDP-2,3-diacylglucosamine hydrolase